MRGLRYFFLLLVAAVFCSAQTDTGTILGNVTDASGGSIPGGSNHH